MAKLKYDVRGVESGGSFEQPKPGLYKCILTDIKTDPSKAGDDMLTCVYEVVSGDYRSAQLWDRVVLTEAAQWKYRQFLEAVGLVKGKKEKGELDTDKLVASKPKVLVRVKGGEYNGEYSAEVSAVLPMPEDDDDDDDLDTTSDADDLSWEDVEEMDLDELAELVEEEELDVKITKRSKVATVRAKVQEELELEEPDDDDGDSDEELTYEDLEEMDLDELKEVIEDEELDVKVTKRSKVATVLAKVAEELELEPEEPEEDDGEEDADEDEEGYDDWSVDELKAELKERGLKATGKKSLLVKRLETDDDEDDDDGDVPF